MGLPTLPCRSTSPLAGRSFHRSAQLPAAARHPGTAEDVTTAPTAPSQRIPAASVRLALVSNKNRTSAENGALSAVAAHTAREVGSLLSLPPTVEKGVLVCFAMA